MRRGVEPNPAVPVRVNVHRIVTGRQSVRDPGRIHRLHARDRLHRRDREPLPRGAGRNIDREIA